MVRRGAEAKENPRFARRGDFIRTSEIEFFEIPSLPVVAWMLAIELLAAPNGTFTIPATRAAGLSSTLAAGEARRWVNNEGALAAI